MNIALLSRKITVQKNETKTDSTGNHRSVWKDFYVCNATVSGESGREGEAAGTTTEHTDIAFTIRSCEAADSITENGYRVIYAGEIYDIVSVDHMSYRSGCVKLRCNKVRR